jgi:MYXO-CTERM domain-containing protein
MKTNKRHSKATFIPNTRWATYATAAAATAIAGPQSAEAAVHYSGRINEGFHGDFDHRRTFTLDQPGDFFVLSRSTYEYGIKIDRFYNFGIGSAAVRGGCCLINYPYVAKLSIGENMSDGPFFSVFGHGYGLLAYADAFGQWSRHGVGFIGFRFNNGAGVQYGWVRILMGRIPGNAFKLVDYAYADPGEPIFAGQTSSNEQAPDQGSLGWLALGAVGLLAWRRSRSRTVRTSPSSRNETANDQGSLE